MLPVHMKETLFVTSRFSKPAESFSFGIADLKLNKYISHAL
ncbi:hypothetical protein ACU8KH_06601 [Lachancea thermotolerans]